MSKFNVGAATAAFERLEERAQECPGMRDRSPEDELHTEMSFRGNRFICQRRFGVNIEGMRVTVTCVVGPDAAYWEIQMMGFSFTRPTYREAVKGATKVMSDAATVAEYTLTDGGPS